MYCALVCKLWSLSKLLQMRRHKVAVHQVLCPFAVVTLGILVIMMAWTLHDPLQWTREPLLGDPRNTYGRCEMEHNLATYLAPLGALILAAMIATASFCWKLRNIQTDLSESCAIFVGIAAHLLLCAIVIPLLIIAEYTSRDVSYIMSASLGFVFSKTLVVCVIWRKLFAWFRDKYHNLSVTRTGRFLSMYLHQ